jgi:AcrR family transcriptional regulator
MAKAMFAPRKRPLQTRSQQTVDDILEASTRILERDGLAGFTTNAVAERAGVSIGSLYQYFPNKDALAVALIEREQQALVDQLADAVAAAAGATLEAGLRILLTAALAGHRRKPRMTAALDHEEARLPISATLAAYQSALDFQLVVFLRWHFETAAETHLLQRAKTVRVIAQSVIDAHVSGKSPDFDLALAEALRAVSGYLRACA